jgi:hypothetical protein
VALDLAYATSMDEAVEAHLLAAAEYRRLSYPKGLGSPELIVAGLLPLLIFLPSELPDAWQHWLSQQLLPPDTDRYFYVFALLGWRLPIVLAPAFIPWLRRVVTRRRLGVARPELRRGAVPTALRLGPGSVEVTSLGRRRHWPPFSCLSLIETTAQYVLLLDEAVVPIPKHALDWPQRADFRAWASSAGLTPRYVITPPRQRVVIAVTVVGLAVCIAVSLWLARLRSGG